MQILADLFIPTDKGNPPSFGPTRGASSESVANGARAYAAFCEFADVEAALTDGAVDSEMQR